jgi:hypothetical protein
MAQRGTSRQVESRAGRIDLENLQTGGGGRESERNERVRTGLGGKERKERKERKGRKVREWKGWDVMARSRDGERDARQDGWALSR